MSVSTDESIARRELLSRDIARQRSELAEAYRNLETPIRYAEYGIKGFGFLRANPWIVMAVPTALKLVFSAIGGKKKSSNLPPAQSGRRNIVSRAVSGGWQLYQLYRRVRSLIP